MILEDVLIPNLRVVFCGTAVSSQSDIKKSYYAGAGNKFYPILNKIKLTPRKLQPSDYKSLIEYGIGLSDLVKTKSGADKTLKKIDFDIEEFELKIIKFMPELVCFNGKKAAAAYLYKNPVKTGLIDYGMQNGTIGKTKLFVAPSTSGRASGFWDENHWYVLAEWVKNQKT